MCDLEFNISCRVQYYTSDSRSLFLFPDAHLTKPAPSTILFIGRYSPTVCRLVEDLERLPTSLVRFLSKLELPKSISSSAKLTGD